MLARNDLAMTPAVIGPPVTVVQNKEVTIQDLWGILSKRRGVFFIVLVLTIALAAVAFAFSTRLYKGVAEIQVQKEAVDTLNMNTVMGPELQSDAIDSNITLQTQAQILQSESLAL